MTEHLLDLDPPATVDVARVLALHLTPRDQWTEAAAVNPLLTTATLAEARVAHDLRAVDVLLATLAAQAAEQRDDLLGRHRRPDDGPTTTVAEVVERIEDPLDRARWTVLALAASPASPLRLGPPDELVPELVGYLGGPQR